jgi:hypothetical protein
MLVWPRQLGAGPNHHLDLLKLRVGSAPTGWGTRLARTRRVSARLARYPLVSRCLNDEVELTLAQIEIIQSVERAD